MPKSIIIIGAGMAGLSAGCYAQMNGYTTHIFEQHGSPGGVCTSWKRKGYPSTAAFITLEDQVKRARFTASGVSSEQSPHDR